MRKSENDRGKCPICHGGIAAIAIGGGPAGMSCGLWLHNFGYEVVMLDKSTELGGAQKASFHGNPWVLGFPSETGETLTRKMVQHFMGLGVTTYSGASIAAIQVFRNMISVEFQRDGEFREVDTDYLVLATGTRPKSTPMMDDLARQSPRVIIGAASPVIETARNSRICIMGGGDNAMENALLMASHSNEVTVIARNDFIARGDFLENCRNNPAITLHKRTVPDRYICRDEGIDVEMKGKTLIFDYLVVLYGYSPNSDFLDVVFKDLTFKRDPHGYLMVDPWQRTNVDRIYAIGDMTNSQPPSMLTAIGQGAVAAKAIDRRVHGILEHP
jgi:thioredoxin reductase (NADPH)